MTPAPPSAAPAGRPPIGLRVAHDPQTGQWLVLETARVAGDPPLLVVSHHADRAVAEAAAGFHQAPAVHWMLLDAGLGWRRRGGRAWMHKPGPVTLYPAAEAAALAAAEPALQMFVVRADGLITCPDIPAAEECS